MNASRSQPSSRLAGTALLSGLLLWVGFLLYGSTGHDDSHINFWNVHTLLTRGEFVNYNGERVEQTTSLLQDLLTAALALLAPSHLVTFGYLVDIAAALGCCLLGTQLARQLCPELAGWMPWLILGSSSFLLWSFGGMGAPLASLCLLAAIRCWTQSLGTAAGQSPSYATLMLITACMTLVRPEMPVVTVAITLALTLLYWREPLTRQRGLLLLTASAVAAIALFGWQQAYFGSWLPIPAVAKQGGDFWPQLQRGTRYLVMGCVQNPVIPVALLASLIPGWQLLRRWLSGQAVEQNLLNTLLASLWAYTGFVWTAGGDWMQAARFLVPVITPASLILVYCLGQLFRGQLFRGQQQLAGNLQHRGLAHAGLALVTALQLAIQYPIIATVSHGIPLWVQTRILPEHASRYGLFEQLNQEHVRDMAVIDRLASVIPVLHDKLQRPVNLISGQAGMVFYYTASQFYGQVHFRDLRGLVESSLTLCPLLHDVPRSPQGLYWGYREFLERLPSLQQQCGIAAPDIIYDLNDMSQKLGRTLEPLGYTMIHQENGFPVENSTRLPANRLLSPNMIFVRNDLLPLLGNPGKQVVDYSRLPLQSRWPLDSD